MESEHAETPAPVGYYKVMPCAGCGVGMRRGRAARKPRYCLACTERRVFDNLRSLVERSGPGYQKMIEGQRRAREEGRGGRGRNRQRT